MPKILQTPEELKVQLRDQIAFLAKSSIEFDKGHVAEAKRLAVAIRILVHDTNNSISLLRLMGVKSEVGTDPADMIFADSSREYDPRNLIEAQHAFNGLVMMHYSGAGLRYAAPLSQPAHGRIVQATFPTWWSKIVYIDVNRENFTRRDLVLAVANQDGGAHVDPGLDEKYVAVSKNNSLGWGLSVNGVEKGPYLGPVFPSIRQVAFELLLSLSGKFPEYFIKNQI